MQVKPLTKYILRDLFAMLLFYLFISLGFFLVFQEIYIVLIFVVVYAILNTYQFLRDMYLKKSFVYFKNNAVYFSYGFITRGYVRKFLFTDIKLYTDNEQTRIIGTSKRNGKVRALLNDRYNVSIEELYDYYFKEEVNHDNN